MNIRFIIIHIYNLTLYYTYYEVYKNVVTHKSRVIYVVTMCHVHTFLLKLLCQRSLYNITNTHGHTISSIINQIYM